MVPVSNIRGEASVLAAPSKRSRTVCQDSGATISKKWALVPPEEAKPHKVPTSIFLTTVERERNRKRNKKSQTKSLSPQETQTLCINIYVF